MDLFEAIDKRHCCRKFDPSKKIDDKIINQLIDVANKAPSAGAIYPTRFAIFKDSDREKLKGIIPERFTWFWDAPIVIVVWTDAAESVKRWGEKAKRLFVVQDGAAAIENIFLKTVELGLGMCWVGIFDDEKLSKLLNLSGEQFPMAVLPIGYKKDE